ncbi:MAG: nucleotidyl transferase protein [uncultured bacterium]|nr:MAG: nucleotidyl transferase protein [uncultured bacterium]OGT34295.1 MAG: hypothetical protein A3C44_07480 [Gammaproteobacteria bacterium RIFCSPHIGHO2_02_FULL_39_13]OGT48944.1 MAG: hypothetical protein A3E53_01460 [Gammaproteobacteria bacterium RIFCSPHIGHO2_12_FULL_39_24]
MIAAILVGGKGSRLQSVISDVPKPLAPVGDTPFLFLLIRKLASYGIKNIILLTGYLHDKIESTCGNGNQLGVDIIYSREETLLGTAGALLFAAPYLKTESTFLFLNGDTFFSGNLNNFIMQSLDDNVALIGVKKVKEADRFGSIYLKSHSNEIAFFAEKQQQQNGLVSAGIYKLSPAVFSAIPENQAYSLETELYPQLLTQGKKLSVVELDGVFYDIGTPESYAEFKLIDADQAFIP